MQSAQFISLGRPGRRLQLASIGAFSSSSSSNESIEEQSNSGSTKPPQEKRLSLHLQRMQQKELRRQYLRKQQRPQQQYSRRVPQQQNLSASIAASVSTQVRNQETNNPTPVEVKLIMDQMHHDLTILLRQINTSRMYTNNLPQAPLPGNIPFWDLENHYVNEDGAELQEHQHVFVRTVELQNKLKDFVERKLIRPSTIHRHEFVALVGDILQIYSCLSCNVATETEECEHALLASTLELVEWIRSPPYGLELSHKQCHAVITVAAKCNEWTTAAQIYIDHIDPDVAGFIPVPVTTASARAFTVAGLYCVARAALKTATLPVENVFDGVTKLTMVSPSDTEQCELSLTEEIEAI